MAKYKVGDLVKFGLLVNRVVGVHSEDGKTVYDLQTANGSGALPDVPEKDVCDIDARDLFGVRLTPGQSRRLASILDPAIRDAEDALFSSELFLESGARPSAETIEKAERSAVDLKMFLSFLKALRKQFVVY